MESCTQMFIEIFIIGKRQKQSICSSTDEQIKGGISIWYEYNLAIERNLVLIHTYYNKDKLWKHYTRTSLTARWIRICLPIQETQVWSLVQEDPTASGQLSLCTTTTDLTLLSPQAATIKAQEPGAQMLQLMNPCTATTEAHMPRTCVQQEKPPQWETHAHQRRVAPDSLQLGKAYPKQQEPSRAKNN